MPNSNPKFHWVIIMLSAAALVSVTFGVRQVFGLFLVPISIEIGSGLQMFSLAIAVQNLIWGLSSPLFGAIADKYGAWRVAAFGTLIYAVGLLFMAFVVNETGVFLGQILIGMGLGSAGISIAVGAVARAAPPEKRSLAMGLVTSFGSFGQFALVPVAQILMTQNGWQFATCDSVCHCRINGGVFPRNARACRESARLKGLFRPLVAHFVKPSAAGIIFY